MSNAVWFVLIPDVESSVHRTSKSYSSERLSLNSAINRVTEGYPYVYIGSVILLKNKSDMRLRIERLIECKPMRAKEKKNAN